MNVVYPINGYVPQGDGSQPPGRYPPPNAGYATGGYPPQGAPALYPGYQAAPVYYPPPGASYPPSGAAYPPPGAAYSTPPLNGYPNPSPGQAYPTYTNMPPQGAYPAYPPGPQPVPGAPYPTYLMRQPPNAYPDPNNPYGAPMNGQPSYPQPGLQPLAQYPMNIGAIPKPGSDLSGQYTMREWSVGLCGCMTHCIPNFFMPWCCPCVSLAQVYARVGLATYKVAVVRFFLLIVSGFVIRFIPISTSSTKKSYLTSTASTTRLTGTAWYVFVACQELVLVVAIAIARRRVRQKFKIPGNRCLDGLAAFFCPCCTIAQMATHSHSYTPGSCDFMGPDVLPASL